MTHGAISFSERIEDYDISREPLGKGGFATVYKARCRKTGIEVAIKMINRRLTEEAGMVERVREEIKIHTRLKHPAIIELYTFFEDAQYVYLVLELAQNGELQRYFKKHNKVMTDTEASRIMRQVVEGLYYLHSQGILHRDLSLSNLLLSHDMHVKIGDFGLAKRAQPEASHKNFTMCGTPNYISPEVASRTSHGPPADIWGLGCMLYTLLVGRPPFDTETVKSTLTRIVMSDYVLPQHLSPEAKDLIQKLLKKNPTERITLPDIMVHPFMTKVFPNNKMFSKPMSKDQRKVLQQYQQSNTVSSQDSGMHTMSSDGYSTNGRFGNSTGGFGSYRSQSEECLSKPTCIPNQNQKQNSQYQIWNKKEYSQNSCYGSLNENTSKYNSLPKSITEHKNRDNKYFQEILPKKIGESIHQEYCMCENPVCQTRRKVYNDTRNVDNQDVLKNHNQNIGAQRYDYCSNKIQIDPGGRILEKDFDRILNFGGGKEFGKNDDDGLEITETPKIPFGRFRSDKEVTSDQNNDMQHFAYQNPGLSNNGYKGLQTHTNGHRVFDPEPRRLNIDTTNSSTPPSRSASQVRDKVFNRDAFQYHAGDFRTNTNNLRTVCSNENFSDEDHPFNENIGVPPLNSARLQPTRHRTKNAILSITAAGEVVIEFIKRKGRTKEERVIDVCRISEDGLRIVLYQPDQGRGVPVRSDPPPLPVCGTDSLHGYETLPEQHCRKYLYAVRFINLVKAKTPKITFYSRLAKCQLMETGADFEANFYEGGKISKNTVEGIKITTNDSCPYLCPYDQTPTLPTSDMRQMWEHFEECMAQCNRLNSLLSWDNSCGQNFPIVVGRRPAPGIAQLHNLDGNKENCPRLEPLELIPFTPSLVPSSSNISSSRTSAPNGVIVSANSTNQRHTASSRRLTQRTPSEHPPATPKTVEVPGIGVATQLASGEVQVKYNDGAVLTVPPMSPGAGVHYTVGGFGAHFRPEDDLPPKLRERLEKISTVIEHLKMAQPPTKAHVGKKRPGLRN